MRSLRGLYFATLVELVDSIALSTPKGNAAFSLENRAATEENFLFSSNHI